MIEYLFIGGTRDGQRIGVANECNGRVELRVHAAPGKGQKRPHPVPTEIYERMEFLGETDKFHVFALRGINGNVVLRALIECYQRMPKEVA